jgi:DNA-binding SARP family transcriptional activator
MPQVCLFGGMTLRLEDGSIVPSSLGQRAHELFAYLTLYEGMLHRREKLAELVWPDKGNQRSRSCLNTTIWRIHALLDSAGLNEHILLDRAAPASIKLEFSPQVQVDCRSLQEHVRQCELAVRDNGGLTDGERQALRSDTDQYAGVFLEGHDSDWVLRERERLHCLYIRGLTLLMHDLSREARYEEALECGKAILAHDEMREVVQREVMWLYVMNGQRGDAVAQYRKFRARVKQELGIEPMSETTALYQHILSDNDSMALQRSDGDMSRPDIATVCDFLRQCARNRASMYLALVRRGPSES